MYGHYPHLPIDIKVGVTKGNNSGPAHKNYAQKLKTRLRLAHKAAKEVSSKESKRHKQYYDHRFHCMALAPGDIVLVRIKVFGQGHRNADKWEQNPHIVLSQMGNQPVLF